LYGLYGFSQTLASWWDQYKDLTIVEYMIDDVHIYGVKPQTDSQRQNMKLNWVEALELLEPTFQMVRTMYGETEVPWNRHSIIVDIQKANGVNLGINHHHK
jgi:hypothetical protein